MLTDINKELRMTSALTFLLRYADTGEEFLNQIVTGDETWIHFDNEETKLQSQQWIHTHSQNKPKKFKGPFSNKKQMATVFWYHHGVLLIDFMEPGTIINAAAYCATLRWLRQLIRNKWKGMPTLGIVLLHYNARLHSAAVTQLLLACFPWEVFDHTPYSPDLVPSDFHLFPALKKWLGGRRFNTNDELQDTVTTWINRQAATFFAECIGKLEHRYDKWLIRHGYYVEK
ncbi:hypothetical protein PR048_004124 [Dryococelus australis]|uniref:Transposase n=1 Tax=Dryococelus australis TaxID=614101 RepID=A0ABQ9I4L2_9NEOP|nr:hypothetical protein PR048_004124 [Dryococelus australis]